MKMRAWSRSRTIIPPNNITRIYSFQSLLPRISINLTFLSWFHFSFAYFNFVIFFISFYFVASSCAPPSEFVIRFCYSHNLHIHATCMHCNEILSSFVISFLRSFIPLFSFSFLRSFIHCFLRHFVHPVFPSLPCTFRKDGEPNRTLLTAHW